MNIVLINADNEEKLFFTQTNNKCFLRIVPENPLEIMECIRTVYTTRNLVPYVEKDHPEWKKIILFERTSKDLRKKSENADNRDVVIYVEWNIIHHVALWLTEKVPFSLELSRV